jgi:hypothetical protein
MQALDLSWRLIGFETKSAGLTPNLTSSEDEASETGAAGNRLPV